jgi:hypothetical protein
MQRRDVCIVTVNHDVHVLIDRYTLHLDPH